MSQEIDYTAVLADLEARRAALDAAIAGVRAVLGQGSSAEVTTLSIPGIRKEGPTRVTPGMFHGLSVSEAARRFLELKKAKQRMKDIVEGIREGGIESSAENFYSNVFTTLQRRKDFIRLGKYWALAEWHPTRSGTVPTKSTRRSKKARKTGGKSKHISTEKTRDSIGKSEEKIGTDRQ